MIECRSAEGTTRSCQDCEILQGGLSPTVAVTPRVLSRIKMGEYEGKEFLDAEATMHLTFWKMRWANRADCGASKERLSRWWRCAEFEAGAIQRQAIFAITS
jgi:hypothetical protein